MFGICCGFFGLEVTVGLLEQGGGIDVLVGGGCHTILGIFQGRKYVRSQFVGCGGNSLCCYVKSCSGSREEKKLKITSSVTNGFGEFTASRPKNLHFALRLRIKETGKGPG